jgi:hypothetical protein
MAMATVREDLKATISRLTTMAMHDFRVLEAEEVVYQVAPHLKLAVWVASLPNWTASHNRMDPVWICHVHHLFVRAWYRILLQAKLLTSRRL